MTEEIDPILVDEMRKLREVYAQLIAKPRFDEADDLDSYVAGRELLLLGRIVDRLGGCEISVLQEKDQLEGHMDEERDYLIKLMQGRKR